jgi:hypothetical protein
MKIDSMTKLPGLVGSFVVSQEKLRGCEDFTYEWIEIAQIPDIFGAHRVSL